MFETAGKKKIAAVLAPVGLVFGLAAGSAMADAHEEFVTSAGDGTGVTTRYGECVKAIGGTAPANCVEPKPEPMMVDGDADGDGVKDSMDKCPGTPRGAKVNSNGCEIIADLTIQTTADHFDFDSATLKPAMMSELDDAARQINASKGNEMLEIIGHTDSTGPADYNQGLSERRAQAAADYLAGKGVAASQMTVKGMGEASPAHDNSTREGRSMNRRVELRTK